MVSLRMSNWTLKSNLKATRSLRVLSHSQTAVSIPCFPVARPETAEFFQGFSFVFTEAGDFGRPVVGSPDGAQPHDGESLSFAAQLDLDLVENALAVSATIADTPEDEDLVDNTLTVSTAAADALEGCLSGEFCALGGDFTST